MAVGYTLNVSTYFTAKGTPDSILTTVTSPQTPTATKWAPRTGSPVTLAIIPSPALLDGQTLTGQSCVVASVKGKLTAPKCAPWTYTRPGVVLDSTVVGFLLLPDTMTATVGDTVHYLAMATYRDGRTVGWAKDFDTRGEAGTVLLNASFNGFTATAKLCVRGGANDPFPCQAFAQYPASRIPPWPRGPVANSDSTWLGRWL